MPKIEFPIEKGSVNRCKMQWSNPVSNFVKNLFKFKLRFKNHENHHVIFIDNKEVLRFSNLRDMGTMKRVKLESGQILEVIHDTEFSFYLDGIRLPAQYAFLKHKSHNILRIMYLALFIHFALIFQGQFELPLHTMGYVISYFFLVPLSYLLILIFGTLRMFKLLLVVLGISISVQILLIITCSVYSQFGFFLAYLPFYLGIFIFILLSQMRKTGGADFYKKDVKTQDISN